MPPVSRDTIEDMKAGDAAPLFLEERDVAESPLGGERCVGGAGNTRTALLRGVECEVQAHLVIDFPLVVAAVQPNPQPVLQPIDE
jgi:hypothetical protein